MDNKDRTRDLVVLVDENDNEIGVEEKLKAHKEGFLHRAFSVFVFDKEGRLLLQKRAKHKYHSGGLWSNTCCSHPVPGETIKESAKRRLKEEMGFTCEVEEVFVVKYKADVGNSLIENEIDHVLVGFYDGDINPNPEEVEDYKWISLEELVEDVKENPHIYTKWFLILLPKIVEWYKKDNIRK